MPASTVGFLWLVLAASVPPSDLAAQADRWLPYTGCWQPVGELAEGQPDLLCVIPTNEGVEFENYLGSELLNTQLIVADGRARAVSEEGCESQDVAEFANSGRFVVTDSEYTCEGGAEGGLKGLIAMVSPIEWIHVQIIESEEERLTGVIRYELALEELTEEVGHADLHADRARALRLSRLAASSPLDVEDVIEASELADPAAVSAWIVERGEVFRPSADRLVRLADAGVPEPIINMVVAVGHPERFAIQTAASGDYATETLGMDRMGMRDGYGYGASGFWGRRGFWGYSPYSLYGYDSFYLGRTGLGYGSYGGYGYWGYRPTVVIVRPEGSSSGGSGRAVRGRGYTRGTGSDSGGSVGRSGGGSTVAPPARSTGRSSTGRKAKRRGGGEL